MGQLFIIAIETFETRVATASGGDAEITSSEWKNLMQKWFVPLESGDTKFDPTADIQGIPTPAWVFDLLLRQYLTGITKWQRDTVSSKPFMLAIESGNIKAYSLDFLIDLNVLEGGMDEQAKQNPDLTNTGNSMIHKFDGGDADSPSGGTIMTEIKTDGKVTKPDNTDLLTFPPLADAFMSGALTHKYPSPFLLFKQPHTS